MVLQSVLEKHPFRFPEHLLMDYLFVETAFFQESVFQVSS